MHTEKLPFSKVNSMVFALEHYIGKNDSNERLPEDCLYVVIESQVKLLNLLKQWVDKNSIMVLTPNNAQDIATSFNHRYWKRMVFLSVTDWHEKAQNKSTIAFFRLIKALLNEPKLKLDIVTVNSFESALSDVVVHPIDSIYVGFAQTLAKECVEWEVTASSLYELTAKSLAQLLNQKLNIPTGTPLSLKGDQYCYPKMYPSKLADWRGSSSFQKGGTYLIIGANGGIGGLLARYLAQNYQASLILVGRSAENISLCKEMKALGACNVNYESMDLINEDEVKSLIDKYPLINGIIHSALLLEDASIKAMTEENFLAVLKPKVHGTIHLINAIRHRQLDFALFFSSIQSYIANAGQANYTAACVCKDALASLLHHGFMIDAKVINWGFWGNIGIVASDTYRKRMEKLEIGSIEAEEGLAIIERFLESKQRQITVIKASDRALKRLSIKPHNETAEQDSKLDANVFLSKIVPTYSSQSKQVQYNEEISDALQQYSRNSFHKINLPDVFDPQFSKLVSALKRIPLGNSDDRETLLLKYPEISGHITLVDTCLEAYPAILSGKKDPLTVMFPEGSFELVEPVYRDNPIADYFNETVAMIVRNYQENHKNRPLRIIEIGAGTGSTTQFVLPQLLEGYSSYTFTDLSFAFLNKGKKRFTAYPFVDYKIYNIEEAPQFEESFDIVIATNVIHATSNLNQSVSHIHQLLKEGGVFILNEITSCQDYATLTFGLTEGWWLSIDEYRIPNSPLLSGDTWVKLLHQCGFSATKTHGSDDQQVIVGYKFQSESGTSQAMKAQEAQLLYNLNVAEVEVYIKSIIAEVMLMAPHEIESDQSFNEYGIDSIISMEIIKPLKNDLGYLPATLLFEFPSVHKLAMHLLTSFEEPLRKRLNVVEKKTIEVIEERDIQTKYSLPETRRPAEDVSSNKALIRHVIAEVMMLELKEIEDNQPFRELGIDSIISLELMKPLKKQFGYLPATLLFEYPTINKLAAYLDEHHRATLLEKKMSNSIISEDLLKINQLSLNKFRPDDIVIVGMSAKLPQADDLFQFWKNLFHGKDSTTNLPKERWDLEGFIRDSSPMTGGSYTSKGAFINNIEAFDNEFFNLTPLDAERMDPQERLFLQSVYHTILDAGYSKSTLDNTNTGVFVGVMNNAYAWHTPKKVDTIKPTSLFWSIANRASYFYNWHGPSMAVDTACSSSLTALHVAIRAIQGGDCRQAIVGGVNLIVHPRQYELLCGMHMLSRSGQCRSFGKDGDGFVDGEGIVSVLVKSYADAVADKDKIYGVVLGSSINSGGKANGYSAPNPDAQAKLVLDTISRAGIEPSEVSYVEAHGTGTELGDPIEIRALASAFKGVSKESIKIGSLKSNIGHLESAAGLSGLIKIILQMQYNCLVPSLHAASENPHLDLANTPFRICKKVEPWPEKNRRIASLSSFGAGGSNAHVILEHYPVVSQTNKSISSYTIIPLSSSSKEGLQQQVDCLRRFLFSENSKPVSLDTLAYMLACGRDHMVFRLAFVVRSKEELKLCLAKDVSEEVFDSNHRERYTSQSHLLLSNKQQADALAKAYQIGTEIDWKAIYTDRKLASIPAYVFKKNRFWIDSYESQFFKPKHIVEEHIILGQKIVPAAWALSLLIQKIKIKGAQNIVWREILYNTEDAFFESNQNTFTISNKITKDIVCSGELITPSLENEDTFFNEMQHSEWVDGETIYADFEKEGYAYGKPMQGLQWARLSKHIVKGCIMVTHDWGFDLSPALIDSGLQLAILMPALQIDIQDGQMMIPYHIGSISIFRMPKKEMIYCYCQYNPSVGNNERSANFDLYFTDVNHQLLICIKDLLSVRVAKEVLQSKSIVKEKEIEDAFIAYELN